MDAQSSQKAATHRKTVRIKSLLILFSYYFYVKHLPKFYPFLAWQKRRVVR